MKYLFLFGAGFFFYTFFLGLSNLEGHSFYENPIWFRWVLSFAPIIPAMAFIHCFSNYIKEILK